MSTWEPLVGIVVAAFVGAYIKHAFFTKPAADNAKIDELGKRVGAVEKQVAIVQETKLTETQVRGIVHEQLQPMMQALAQMQVEQLRQGSILIRIEERMNRAGD